VFENAVVHRVDPTLGILVELPLKNFSAAAYIHISNVSDEHVAKLGKKYCVGKKVCARVVGFRVMDGLAIASLKDSVVEQLLISHADVKPAMIVRGTVAATEPFGSFIQLADGLRALCPLQHMSDFQRTAPSAKFQVGVRLKFRVMTCHIQTRKITLTHKKTLVSIHGYVSLFGFVSIFCLEFLFAMFCTVWQCFCCRCLLACFGSLDCPQHPLICFCIVVLEILGT
jgi:rRNA biogenesis protein RRP5